MQYHYIIIGFQNYRRNIFHSLHEVSKTVIKVFSQNSQCIVQIEMYSFFFRTNKKQNFISNYEGKTWLIQPDISSADQNFAI